MGCSHTRLCLQRIKFLTVKLKPRILKFTGTSFKTTTQNMAQTKVDLELGMLENESH